MLHYVEEHKSPEIIKSRYYQGANPQSCPDFQREYESLLPISQASLDEITIVFHSPQKKGN